MWVKIANSIMPLDSFLKVWFCMVCELVLGIRAMDAGGNQVAANMASSPAEEAQAWTICINIQDLGS